MKKTPGFAMLMSVAALAGWMHVVYGFDYFVEPHKRAIHLWESSNIQFTHKVTKTCAYEVGIEFLFPDQHTHTIYSFHQDGKQHTVLPVNIDVTMSNAEGKLIYSANGIGENGNDTITSGSSIKLIFDILRLVPDEYNVSITVNKAEKIERLNAYFFTAFRPRSQC